ncbi:MAG: bacterial Ig-like domain-containing protein [Eubacterium sp.]|nr:bacterial Ig-like domain-containing protein [Eubacterium sp.]
MKKRKILSIILSGLLVASSFIMPSNIKQVNADAAVLETNVTTAGEGKVLVGIQGTFYSTEENKMLDLMNQVRKEAYDEKLEYPKGSGKHLGIDYSYEPLKWSNACETIARIRAAEVTTLGDHLRPSGGKSSSMSLNGFSPNGEVIAWNDSILNAICNKNSYTDQGSWYSEKQYYLDPNDKVHETGHYVAMIRPDNKYVGIAGFRGDYSTSSYSNFLSVLGIFSMTNSSLDTSFSGINGQYIQKIEVLAKYVKLNISGNNVLYKDDTSSLSTNATLTTVSGDGSYNCKVYSDVVWSIDDDSIATIDSATGELVAKKAGVTTVTASIDTGSSTVQATTSVVVLDNGVTVDSLVAPSEITVNTGTKPDLPATVKANLSNGEQIDVNVDWDPMETDYRNSKSYNYCWNTSFDVEGHFSTLTVKQRIKVIAQIHSITLSEDTITTDSGVKPTYPTVTSISLVNGMGYSNPNDYWVWEANDEYKNVKGGTFEIEGHCTMNNTKKASFTLIVNPATVTNVQFKQAGAIITTPSGTAPKYPKATVSWTNHTNTTDEDITWANAEPTEQDRKYKAREGGSYTLTGSYAGHDTSVTINVTPATVDTVELADTDKTRVVSCGTKPVLANTATVKWSNGDTTDEAIEWDEISSEDYNCIEGKTFSVSGTCKGETVTTVVTVNSANFVSYDALDTVITPEKKAPVLPDKVNVLWSNQQKREEPVTWNAVSSSSYSTANKSFKVQGYVKDPKNVNHTVEVTVKVVPRSISKIEWKEGSPSVNPSYYTYNKSDLSGTIIATYDNGDTEEVSVTSDMITGFDADCKDKTQTVTITYLGKELTAQMNLISRTGIEISTLPTKTEYIEGQSLDIKGMVVKELLDNNTSRVIPSSEYSIANCSGFTSRASTYGNQEITFSLYGYTEKFVVNVRQRQLENAQINTLPKNTKYVQGQTPDSTGMVVYGIYDNGDSEVVSFKKENIRMYSSGEDPSSSFGKPWNTNEVGKHTCYVWVPVSVVTDGNGTTTTSYVGDSFEIEVVAKELTSLTWVSKPTKTTYPQNDKTYSETSFADGKVLATYNDGDTKELALTDEGVSVTGFDITKVGTQTVAVSYGGKSVTFDATVTEPQIIKTYVIAPTKTGYVQGDVFELDGAKIVFAKDNGYDETIDVTTNNSDIAITLGGSSNITSPLTNGAKTLAISYKGTALKDIDGNDITINVAERTGISVKTNPTTTTYVEGTALADISLDGLQLEAEFEGGAKSLIPSKDVSLDTNADYDTSKLGTQKIYVTAYGYSTSFDVTIREKRLTGLTVETQPSKTTYAKGQAIDITGLVVKGTYDNGTTGYVDVTKDNLRIGSAANTFGSVANTNTVGALGPKVVVAVTGDDGTYYVASDVIQLTVEEKTVSSVSILTKPSKLTFTQNASDFNSYRFADGKLKASCNCGLEEEVSFNDPNVTITGFDISKAGNQTVTVSYGGKSATFVVTVTASNPNPGNNGSGNGGSGNGNNNNVSGGNGTGNGNGTGGNNGSGNSNSTGNNNGSGNSNSIGNNNGSVNSNGTGSDNGTGNNVDTPATPAPAAPTYSNEWVNGVWYDENGNNTYSGTLSWKSNSTGWWVEDSAGWYPVSCWQKIDGEWYYFNSSGYMASSEWYNGYWFNGNGTWDSTYKLTWRSNSTGWWIEDISGWWPSNCWQKIDGSWYYFDASGYMVTSRYIDGYWIGANGVCQ